MINIKGPNVILPYGPCYIMADCEGWYQWQEEFRAYLDVEVAQISREFYVFNRIHSRPIKAMMDTGCWFNIINSETFISLGYSLPKEDAADLRIAGIVNDPTGEQTLCGWRVEVRLAPARSTGCGFAGLRMPLYVATNFKMADKFIVGLEFLRKYSVLLKDDLTVLGRSEAAR